MITNKMLEIIRLWTVIATSFANILNELNTLFYNIPQTIFHSSEILYSYA